MTKQADRDTVSIYGTVESIEDGKFNLEVASYINEDGESEIEPEIITVTTADVPATEIGTLTGLAEDDEFELTIFEDVVEHLFV